MSRQIDMTGKRCGILTVVSMNGSNHLGRLLWNCRCDCGSETVVEGWHLRSGKTKSCGCLVGNTTHGHTRGRRRSLTASSYSSMIDRCTNKNSPAFPHYSKNGITVCDRWFYGENGKSGFHCFLDDMGERTEKWLTVERIDNEKGYFPGNCRWATMQEQGNNRSTNTVLEYRGKTYTMAELSRATGVSKEILRHRISRAGWSVIDAVETPPCPGRRMDIERAA